MGQGVLHRSEGCVLTCFGIVRQIHTIVTGLLSFVLHGCAVLGNPVYICLSFCGCVLPSLPHQVYHLLASTYDWLYYVVQLL
jgi:hypothetical protein